MANSPLAIAFIPQNKYTKLADEARSYEIVFSPEKKLLEADGGGRGLRGSLIWYATGSKLTQETIALDYYRQITQVFVES